MSYYCLAVAVDDCQSEAGDLSSLFSGTREMVNNPAFLSGRVVSIVIGLLMSLTSAAGKLSDSALYCQYSDVFKRSACLIEHEMRGIDYSLGSTLSPIDMDIYRALEAMSFVQNTAGSGRYTYISVTKGKSPSMPMDQQSIMLKRGYGICGNHQAMFLELMTLLKMKVRPVDFYYIDSKGIPCSHAAAEVKIGNKWRYFDITWGSIWLEERGNLSSLLSVEDILSRRGKRLSGINGWYLHFKYPHVVSDPFEYLHARQLQVLKGKGGLLTVPIVNNRANFDGLPRYIGKIESDNAPMRIKFDGLVSPVEAVLTIESIGGFCTQPFMGTSAGYYPIHSGKILLTLNPGSELTIQGEKDVCYAVVNDIELITNRHARMQQAPLEYAALKFMVFVNAYLYRETMS